MNQVVYKQVNILISRAIIGFLVTKIFLELGLVFWIGSERCKLPYTALYFSPVPLSVLFNFMLLVDVDFRFEYSIAA